MELGQGMQPDYVEKQWALEDTVDGQKKARFPSDPRIRAYPYSQVLPETEELFPPEELPNSEYIQGPVNPGNAFGFPGGAQCVRGPMGTLYEAVPALNPALWHGRHRSGLGFMRQGIGLGQRNLESVWQDKGPAIDVWGANHERMRAMMADLLENPLATWRMYEMDDMQRADNQCSGVLSHEQVGNNCRLNLIRPPQSDEVKALASGSFSVIFLAQRDGQGCAEYPDRVVVKYANNCKNHVNTPEARYAGNLIRDADDAVMEYIVMRLIGNKEIAPRAFALSAPSVPRRNIAWSRDPRLESSVVRGGARSDCGPQKAMVRGIVQERIDTDLGTFISTMQMGAARLRFTIKSGQRTIQALKELHDSGFYHGDLHKGNVALQDPRGEKLVLIDFGLSDFFPSRIGDPENFEWTGSLNTVLLSPWHLANQRLGRRDDIFRAIEMVASLLARGDLERRMGGVLHRQAFKTNGRYFDDANDTSICNSFGNPHGCSSAMNQLNQALAVIRTTPTPDARPKYEIILDHFSMALKYLDNRVIR
jgi:serine/threonine protein kinase